MDNEKNDEIVYINPGEIPPEQNQTQVVPELKGPRRKRKAPLTVSAVFTVIGAVVFALYVIYMISMFQMLSSHDASGIFAIFVLPVAILIGLIAMALNLTGMINAIFAIPSDITRVKTWGIILTILNVLFMLAAVGIFFLTLYTQ